MHTTGHYRLFYLELGVEANPATPRSADTAAWWLEGTYTYHDQQQQHGQQDRSRPPEPQPADPIDAGHLADAGTCVDVDERVVGGRERLDADLERGRTPLMDRDSIAS